MRPLILTTSINDVCKTQCHQYMVAPKATPYPKSVIYKMKNNNWSNKSVHEIVSKTLAFRSSKIQKELKHITCIS